MLEYITEVIQNIILQKFGSYLKRIKILSYMEQLRTPPFLHLPPTYLLYSEFALGCFPQDDYKQHEAAQI